MFTANTAFDYNASRNSSTSSYQHDTANVITTTIGGTLSMIGVTLIVVSYSKLEEIRLAGTTAQRILLCISTADFISAATSVIGVWFSRSAGAGCEAEGFLIIFATTASFFWTACLAIHLFLVMMNQTDLVGSRKVIFSFHFASWGLPLLFAVLALSCGALGPSPFLSKSQRYVKLTTGGWCWIKHFEDKSKTIAWTLMTSKLWEITSYFIITVVYWVIFCQLRLKLGESVDVGRDTLSAARKVERRMLFVPIAFILLRIWGTVRYFAYVSNFAVRESVLENIPLYALQGLGDSSQGLANSIFFFLSNKRVLIYWKAIILEQCSFFCYKENARNERAPILSPRQLNAQF